MFAPLPESEDEFETTTAWIIPVHWVPGVLFFDEGTYTVTFTVNSEPGVIVPFMGFAVTVGAMVLGVADWNCGGVII